MLTNKPINEHIEDNENVTKPGEIDKIITFEDGALDTMKPIENDDYKGNKTELFNKHEAQLAVQWV